jgi:hypothetical protein
MRKSIILAFATMFLACVTVVTGVARSIEDPSVDTTLASLVVSPHTIGSLTARIFNAI